MYYTVKQVAELFDSHVTTIWRWCREDAFPQPVHLGPNKTRWLKSEVDSHLKEKVGAR